MLGNVDHFELEGDGASVTALTGWALDPDAPDAPVEVLASLNGVPWGNGTASVFREDLVRLGRAGQLAFRIPLRMPLAITAGLLDGEGLRVVAASGPDRPAQWLPFNEQYFIEPLRKIRDAESPATGTVAVFTMAYNEPRNLPLWIQYYGVQLGLENCWVLDHGSSDGSTDGLPCHRVRLPRDPMDSLRRAQRCSAFQHFLLRFYDTVIYVDSDEFLVPDPRHYASLSDWCAQRRNRNVRAFGFDV
ncbi:MAG: glycosyltransferase family 2 protein, partial [Cyanobacteriota bacterium]|nr:glycosyltransferase family 2 protein [Cyanobacteriota bacterium]